MAAAVGSGEQSEEVGGMSRCRSEQNKNGKTAVVESLGRAVEAKARLAQAGRLTRVREERARKRR